MKVGDLIVYNLEPVMPGDEKGEMVAIVVAESKGTTRSCNCGHHRGSRNFRIYYPHYNDFLNGWEDDYRVISS